MMEDLDVTYNTHMIAMVIGTPCVNYQLETLPVEKMYGGLLKRAADRYCLANISAVVI